MNTLSQVTTCIMFNHNGGLKYLPYSKYKKNISSRNVFSPQNLVLSTNTYKIANNTQSLDHAFSIGDNGDPLPSPVLRTGCSSGIPILLRFTLFCMGRVLQPPPEGPHPCRNKRGVGNYQNYHPLFNRLCSGIHLSAYLIQDRDTLTHGL